MEQWILKPELLEADENAEYAEIIEIDLINKIFPYYIINLILRVKI